MQTQTSQPTSRSVRRRGPFVALAVVIAAFAGACAPASGGGFNTPGINITGATVTIPGINVNPGAGTVSVPNIQVNLPSIQVQLPSLVVCSGVLNLGTINLPAKVAATGVLNLGAGTLTINATITIPFEILGVSFPINIPIGPIAVQL